MNRPKIVCLCGSTSKALEAFRQANLEETLDGNIVLTIGADMHSDDELFASMTPEELQETKLCLDALHLCKIDLADEVLILNVGGYIGESTRNEIKYAMSKDKVIRYLEPIGIKDVLDGLDDSQSDFNRWLKDHHGKPFSPRHG